MNFPNDFDPSRCVLFLGSGFSAAATNKLKGSPPVGAGLRDAILQKIGSSIMDGDLKDVAGYAVKNGLDLHKLLSEIFTITGLNAVQESILRKQWRRIYTTNYDDAVEFFEKKNGRQIERSTFTIGDPRPIKVLPDSIVHLHGYIHRCDRDNVLNQLVLDHRSYAEQAAFDSPWWDQMRRDFQGAQWVFFVGYSLNDFAVARYLTAHKSLSNKVCFILQKPIDAFVSDRLSGYGEAFDMGASGFASLCDKAKSSAPIRSFHEMESFQLMDPYKDNKSVRKPTPVEIEAFLSRGKYNFQSLSSTFPNLEFAIPRAVKIAEAVDKISTSRTILLHSRTANGKSIFADMLSLSLSQKGGTCVRYRSHTSIPPQELAFLSTVKELYVFVPSYDDAIEISDDLETLPSHVKFVVEINTGTDQVRRTEVQKGLIKPIQRVDLNPLTPIDLQGFEAIIDRAGLPSPVGVGKKGPIELRDILIRLLESPYVRQRIKEAIEPIVSDKDAIKVVAAISILKSFGIHVSPDYIRAVTKEDPLDTLLRNHAASAEFGDFSPDHVSFHSSVFCDYFLREFIGPGGVASVICRLAFEAARRKDDNDASKSQRSREARKALGALLQFGNISPIFRGLPNSDQHISEIYETLRDNSRINAEPLFWLQYSIYMQDKGKYGIARKHLEAAYLRAEQISGFLTYQLDTNYLRLILQAPDGEDGFPGDMEILFGLIDKIRTMILAEDHRVHALKVLEDIRVFCRNHGKGLSVGERQRLSIQCLGIVGDLDTIGLDIKVEFGTNFTKEKVKEAISILSGNI
jgi:hypothetical protein